MSNDSIEEVVLEVPIGLEYDLEINKDGVLVVQTELWLDEDMVTPVSMPFYLMVDGLLDSTNKDLNFNTLFAIANDLTREAERVREVAIRIEDSNANVADLFNTSFDPT
jgi:hypothetical protein|tara:strand:- start:101 stop:427 length:327 start_codon:yes stop_codon:yes gene_type:complete